MIPSALCSVDLSKPHVPSKKVNSRVRSRYCEIYCEMYCEPKDVLILLLSFIWYFIRDDPTDLVWSSFRVP